jgi:hypothetical protein
MSVSGVYNFKTTCSDDTRLHPKLMPVKKKSKTKKKTATKKKVTVKESAADKEERENRKKNEQILKNSRRRGNLIDFTVLKLGSLTSRKRRIVKCKACGQKGELSASLGVSTVIIHRGVAKPGDVYPGSDNQQRIRMTEFCVGG